LHTIYNTQWIYDSGIILASSVTQDSTDYYQLVPQIGQIIDTLGPLPDDTKN